MSVFPINWHSPFLQFSFAFASTGDKLEVSNKKKPQRASTKHSIKKHMFHHCRHLVVMPMCAINHNPRLFDSFSGLFLIVSQPCNAKRFMVGPDTQKQSLKTQFSRQELHILSFIFTVDSKTKFLFRKHFLLY